MKTNEKRLQFLIAQVEERIRLVDIKSSIILAFYGILISNNDLFLNILKKYHISLLISYLILLLFLLSVFFLIITIRPVKTFVEYFFHRQRNESKDYWITRIEDAENFNIQNVKDHLLACQELYIELQKRRINKYKFYRCSMWTLRLILILVFLIFIKMAVINFELI